MLPRGQSFRAIDVSIKPGALQHQRMIAAYRREDRRRGRELIVKLIESISTGVPKSRVEVIKLGRTLKKRASDVLAYFDRPGMSNGPDRGDQRPTRPQLRHPPQELAPRVRHQARVDCRL